MAHLKVRETVIALPFIARPSGGILWSHLCLFFLAFRGSNWFARVSTKQILPVNRSNFVKLSEFSPDRHFDPLERLLGLGLSSQHQRRLGVARPDQSPAAVEDHSVAVHIDDRKPPLEILRHLPHNAKLHA